MRRPGLPVCFGGIVLALAAETTLDGWDQPSRWLPDLAVGLTLLTCGLVAGRLRPGWWSGWLLTAAGVVWFLPNFSGAGPALVGPLAATLLFVHRGPLLHLVLAYPQGRTSSRPLQATIAGAYVATIAQAFWPQPLLPVGVAVVVLVVALGRYVAGSRADRRARLVALAVALAWAVLIGGAALTQALAPAPGQDDHLLLEYEASVGLVAIALTFGLRSTGWDRALVTDLVVELGAASGGGLRGELAAVLGDPGLEVGYWVDETASYVDADGQPLALRIDGDGDGDGRSTTVIQVEGRPIAVLLHDASDPADPGLVAAVADAVRLVAAHYRLQVEVRDRVTEVQASRLRILAAADEERRRLEARVREGALTRLEALTSLLDRAQATARGPGLVAQVDAARGQLARTQEDLQRLAHGIHPSSLAQRGLGAALLDLTADSAVPVTLAASTTEAPPAVAAAAYYICSEALANAVKHSAATGVTVTLTSPPGLLVVEICDDGRGGADPARGSGLQGLVDRVAALGGTLEVASPQGRGTRLVAAIPTSAPPDAG